MGKAKALEQARAAEQRRRDDSIGERLHAALQQVRTEMEGLGGAQAEAVVVVVGGRAYSVTRGPGLALHEALGSAQKHVERAALTRLVMDEPPAAEEANGQPRLDEEAEEALASRASDPDDGSWKGR